MSNDIGTDSTGLLFQLSSTVCELMKTPLPHEVEAEARRALLNILGTSVAGERHPGSDSIFAAATEISGFGNVRIPGRNQSLNPYWAALATGFASHVDDFDDTHLARVIHPGAAALGAIVGTGGLLRDSGEIKHVSNSDGAEVGSSLRAFALGIEVQLRLGMALGVAHYDAGWHTTGTCGVMGATVQAGLMLGLSEKELAGALGIAASSTIGNREGFGSDCKAFHPGKAAGTGLVAALAAMQGVESSEFAIEGPRGFLRVMSAAPEESQLLQDFGERWHLLDLTYKPYPCGIVSHPLIDASIQLHELLNGEVIDSVRVICHPLVPDLMGKRKLNSGLEARFSAVHAVAAGLLDGEFGLDHVTDTVAVRRDLSELRERIVLEPNSEFGRAEASVIVLFQSGRSETATVKVARGSLEKPLTNEEVRSKAKSLLLMRLSVETVEQVLNEFDNLAEDVSLLPLIDLCCRDDVSDSDGSAALTKSNEGSELNSDISEINSIAVDLAPNVTEMFCKFAIDFSLDKASEEVRHAGQRIVANALSLGSAGMNHDGSKSIGLALDRVSSKRNGSIFSKSNKLDLPWAALLNGVAIHIEDFDDTHLDADIHLSAPIVPAVLAAAEMVGATGKDVLEAIIVAGEISIRLSLGMSPDHFHRGWHVTGTVGHIGAAIGAGRILRLDEERLRWAVGIAATQAAGLQAAFGSTTKSWHAGKAAADGLEAAVLAKYGFTGPAQPIEGRRGFALTTSSSVDFSKMVAGLGDQWKIVDNSFKPYACGLLGHPIIDSAIAVRRRLGNGHDNEIDKIEIGVNPNALDVMGIKEPTTSLQGKFSIYHCFAAAFVDGSATPTQFSTSRVVASDVVKIRKLIIARADNVLPKDAAWVRVTLADGSDIYEVVEHALGSLSKPLSDSDLREKAVGLIGEEFAKPTDEMMDLAFQVQDLPNVSLLFEAARHLSG